MENNKNMHSTGSDFPNRVYDLRDVAMNAAGSVLGVVVLAACRAGRVSDGSSSRR